MLKSISDIGKLVLEKHGIFGFILFAFIILICYCTVELLKTFIKSNFIQKNILKKNKENNLKKHFVFKTLEDLIKYKIDAIEFNCLLRRELFKSILKIKYQTMSDNLMELTNDDWEISVADARARWRTFFSKTQHDWVTECYADGVPKIAIIKYLEVSKPTNEFIEKTVEDICLTPPFSKKNNAVAIFSLIPTMEMSALCSLNKTLQKLNGELSNQSYKGISCKTCKDKCEFENGKIKNKK